MSQTNPSDLKHLIDDLLKQSNFNIISFRNHHFQPYGYTAVWLLSESHLPIHTFPEEGKTYLELSGCSEEKNEIFKQKILKYPVEKC